MIEKKCCDNKGNVEVYFKYNTGDCCGCQCECGCEEEQKPEGGCNGLCCNCGESPKAVLEISVGEGGDFATLREALVYVRNIAANVVNINFISDVIEKVDETIVLNRAVGNVPVNLNGNGHVLDLSNVKKEFGLMVLCNAVLRVTNLTIKAPNVTLSAIAADNDSLLGIQGNVKVITGGASKTQWGISAHSLSKIVVFGVGNSIENCLYGIGAYSSSFVTVWDEMKFINVTNQYLPVKNTVGNNNSYIDVHL